MQDEIDELRQAIEQAGKQEPCGTVKQKHGYPDGHCFVLWTKDIKPGDSLYLHPPTAPAQPLGYIGKHVADSLMQGCACTTTMTKHMAFEDDLAIYTEAAPAQPFQPDWVSYRQGVEDGKAEAQQPLTQPDKQRLWNDACYANRSSFTDAAMDYGSMIEAAHGIAGAKP